MRERYENESLKSLSLFAIFRHADCMHAGSEDRSGEIRVASQEADGRAEPIAHVGRFLLL